MYSCDGDKCADTDYKEALKILTEKVDALYHFRDHFFENHSLSKAVNRSRDIETELNKTIELFDKYKDCSQNAVIRAKYYYLKGRSLNVVSKYNKEAEEALSKAIKLDPKLIEAWNELGECYWKNDNIKEATNCFNKTLIYGKNKIALRNLSMLARQKSSNNQEENRKNIEQGLNYAKDAVQLDPHDGLSWAVLGNAHLSSFFGITQNPKTLKQCIGAYSQAEKDIVAKTTPDLHYNKGITLKYEEEFQSALESFNNASLYDPTWEPAMIKENQLVKYLNDINELVSTCGKMKSKRLHHILQSIDSKHLGPYGGGSYTSSNGQTVQLEEVALNELKAGINEEKVVLGKVVCSVHNEDTVPLYVCTCHLNQQGY